MGKKIKFNVKKNSKFKSTHTGPGRQAKVSADEMYEALKDVPLFYENGDLKKMRHPIWQDAIKLLPDINLHNLYQFIYQDRKNIRTKLARYNNIDNIHPSKKRKIEEITCFDSKWEDCEYENKFDEDDDKEVNSGELDALIAMKEDESFKADIRKIEIIPFQILYWKLEQTQLWEDLNAIESVISLIVLDKIVTKVKDKFESNDIFTVALATHLEGSVTLIAQMMSDSLETVDVHLFLTNWLQQKLSQPETIVVGYSYRLLDATSLAFNFCTFDNYNKKCYQYLLNEVSELPPTLIHIDIITLIKVIDAWQCFENVEQSIKDLYLCGIMYLSTINSMEEFEETVLTLLILCQGSYRNDEMEIRRLTLWAHLTSETIQQLNKKFIQLIIGKNGPKSFSYLNIKQNALIKNLTHPIYEYIFQLKVQALEICNSNKDDAEKTRNPYFCPGILDNMVQLFSEFPSWTKIILKESVSSSLSSICATDHLGTLHEITDSTSPSQFLPYHLKKVKKMTSYATRFITNINNRKVKSNSNQTKSIQLLTNHPASYGNHNKVEIIIPTEEIAKLEPMDETEERKLDVYNIKKSIESVIQSFVSFDEYIEKLLKTQIKSGDEIAMVKILFDCCTEQNEYESSLGTIARRLCLGEFDFPSAFRQIFINCYNTANTLNENQLKNGCKLFAHLLISDSISWNVISVLQLNSRAGTAEKLNFVRFLFKELAKQIGNNAFLQKLEAKSIKLDYTGIFPNNAKDAAFANNFFKSIGIKQSGRASKKPERHVIQAGKHQTEEVPTINLEGNSSDSNSSDDIVLEVRILNKKTKQETDKDNRHTIVIKK